VRLANLDVTDARAADTLGRNSSCLGLATRDAADTREADTLGRNSYSSLLTADATHHAGGRQLGTHLIHAKQTPWDATLTIS
jgi:hypothetical protein